MVIEGLNVLAAVVSADRPQQVPRISGLCDWPNGLLWVVPRGQADDYQFQGAEHVLEVDGPRPNICGSRNALLDMAFDDGHDAVVMLDDDTKLFRFVYHYEGTSAWHRPVKLQFVVEHLLRAMQHHPEAKLGGIAPTASWLFVSGGARIKTRAFIQSNFALVKHTSLRYDQSLELSEDYDYCIAHIAKYGCIVRDDLILGDYVKRTNGGGLQMLDDREARDIASREKLRDKWPEWVEWPHRRHGPREVTIRWRAING